MSDIYLNFNDIINEWCNLNNLSDEDIKLIFAYIYTEQGRKSYDEIISKKINEAIATMRKEGKANDKG